MFQHPKKKAFCWNSCLHYILVASQSPNLSCANPVGICLSMFKHALDWVSTTYTNTIMQAYSHKQSVYSASLCVIGILESKNVVDPIGTQDRTDQYQSHMPTCPWHPLASLGIPWHPLATLWGDHHYNQSQANYRLDRPSCPTTRLLILNQPPDRRFMVRCQATNAAQREQNNSNDNLGNGSQLRASQLSFRFDLVRS